jgi:hypothetical protein
MPSSPEELAEEMAGFNDRDIDPDVHQAVEAWSETPEGQHFVAKLQALHEELVRAPTAANLKKIQDCQWEIFQNALGRRNLGSVH